jgi:hypothetical protein
MLCRRRMPAADQGGNPMTTKYLTGAYPGGYALNAKYSGLVIEASATVGGTGVSASFYTTIENQGMVTAAANGVYLAAGGLVTNGSAVDVTAVISGDIGVAVKGASGVVINYGTISGYSTKEHINLNKVGVYLGSGGMVTNGSATDTSALIAGVSATGGATTIVNFGTIAVPQVQAVGLSRGTVVNGSATDTTALIGGIRVLAGRATITNFGSITGQVGMSSDLIFYGGIVTNGSRLDHTALISGVLDRKFAATITNFGTIDGGSATGVTLYGGLVTNGSASDTVATILGGLYDRYTPGTFVNFGTISGVAMLHGGQVTNGSITDTTASIDSVEDRFSSATITNYGAITGGVTLYGGGVSSGSAGDITATVGYVFDRVSAATITNYGAISGGVTLYGGMFRNGSASDTTATTGPVWDRFHAATITNYGAITGSVTLYGGVVSNGSAGDTTATIGSALDRFSAATITNYGVITGGVTLYGGVVSNGSAGDITATIGYVFDRYVDHHKSTATITNYGAITGGVTLYGGIVSNGSAGDTTATIGYVVDHFSAATITNYGAIVGVSGHNGVNCYGGVLTNGSATDTAALIQGVEGVYSRRGRITVTNFGAISGTGGTAVQFSNARDLLQVEAGSVFLGAVLGDGSRLNLASGTGTLDSINGGDIVVSGRGRTTTYSNFGALSIQGGARFTLTGSGVIAAGGTDVLRVNGDLDVAGSLDVAGKLLGGGTVSVSAGATAEIDNAAPGALSLAFKGAAAILALKDPSAFAATISGFAPTDSIDLLGIAATSAGLGAGDTLVITNGSAPVATLQLAGDYVGDTFSTASDGKGGTSITVTAGARSPPPTAPATIPTPHALIAAAASLGAEAMVGHATANARVEALQPTLTSPRQQFA